MPHPKMRESIMTSPENTSLAEQLCPFLASAQECRPAVALALQSKDDSAALEIDRLNTTNAELGGALVQMANAGGDQIREIDRLKEEIGKLRAALELFAKMADGHEDALDCATIIVCLGDLRKARAALQTDGGKL